MRIKPIPRRLVWVPPVDGHVSLMFPGGAGRFRGVRFSTPTPVAGERGMKRNEA